MIDSMWSTYVLMSDTWRGEESPVGGGLHERRESPPPDGRICRGNDCEASDGALTGAVIMRHYCFVKIEDIAASLSSGKSRVTKSLDADFCSWDASPTKDCSPCVVRKQQKKESEDPRELGATRHDGCGSFCYAQRADAGEQRIRGAAVRNHAGSRANMGKTIGASSWLSNVRCRRSEPRRLSVYRIRIPAPS
ncbi:hypothetical protein NL676_031953 [Syzygium grande]|nr:hypothetical protein NL676_031953 [Syzygium grande]